MATTVKVKFRPSTVAGRPGTIVYFVTYHHVVRQITTSYVFTNTSIQVGYILQSWAWCG